MPPARHPQAARDVTTVADGAEPPGAHVSNVEETAAPVGRADIAEDPSAMCPAEP
ncbi:hypothetical protein [Streptomyces sp. NPDC008317]|uniref:hypothetical protein n=1 Tax=Streptomyces sp. NPDC008317 TaxID=3364827 RepID=UPI0036F114E8